MLNKSLFNGRLTRDIELKYTKNTHKPVAQFTLAVQREYKNGQGNYDADFLRFLVWDKRAENMVNYTRKGLLIFIESHTVTSNYQKDGQTVYRTDNVVDKFNILESRRDADNNRNSSSDNNDSNGKRVDNMQRQNENRNNNQTNSNYSDDAFADNSTPIDISDDDLPF